MNIRKKLYIAYGSNLNMRQMKKRCPDARLLYVGELRNWGLVFRGSHTGSYATIYRKKGSIVPVGVWEISGKDEKNLDRYEGYPTFYHKQNVFVTLQDGSRTKGMVYIMRKDALPGRPSEFYVDTIRQGYIDTGLDLDYLDKFIFQNWQEMRRGIF